MAPIGRTAWKPRDQTVAGSQVVMPPGEEAVQAAGPEPQSQGHEVVGPRVIGKLLGRGSGGRRTLDDLRLLAEGWKAVDKRLELLVAAGKITADQMQKVRGLSLERCRFELAAIEKAIEAGPLDAATFAQLERDAECHATARWQEAVQEEWLGLQEQYAPSLRAFAAAKTAARPPVSFPGPLHLPLPTSGEGPGSIAAHVRAELAERGLSDRHLKVRLFDARRLDLVLRTGTDRDLGSSVDHVDGIEPTLMRLFEIPSAQATTYASDLANWSGPGTLVAGCYDAIAVYDADRLFKIGEELNGFHAFLGAPSWALVAVFSAKSPAEAP